MTTYTGTRGGLKFPETQPWSGATATAWGNFDVAVAPVIGDFYELCKLPLGAVVVDGHFRSSDLDTAGPTLTFDVGYAGNDTAYSGLTPVVAGAPANNTDLPLANASTPWVGFQPLATDVTIRLRCAAAATTFAAGTVSVVLHYTMP